MKPAHQDSHRYGVAAPDHNESRRQFLTESRRAMEQALRARKIKVQPPDHDIARRLRAFSLTPGAPIIVRFSWLDGRLLGHIFRDGTMWCRELDFSVNDRPVWDALKSLPEWRVPLAGYVRDGWQRNIVPPTPQLAEQMYDLLFRPLFEAVDYRPDQENTSRIFIIPSGPLFEMPLHAAWMSECDLPLCACVPLAFCFSATALVTRGRFANATIRIEESDDLCVLGCQVSEHAMSSEAANIFWNAGHYYFSGSDNTFHFVSEEVRQLPPPERAPQWLSTATEIRRLGHGDRHSFQQIQEIGPEFLLFHGHSERDDREKDTGPILVLERGEYASQYDIAASRWLRDNKLSVLAACVTGRDAVGDGGEVSGLLRAVAAAGGSALSVCLWEVLDSPTEMFVQQLFRELLNRASCCGLPETYRDVTRALINEYLPLQLPEVFPKQAALECCVFSLYV